MSNTISMRALVETDLNRSNDGYEHLEGSIRESFELATASNEPLFVTSSYLSPKLYDIFLNNLPEEARQYYNCRSCRNFVNRYGGLVTIDDYGYIHPVMWAGFIPEFFRPACEKVRKAVMESKVIGVFISSERRLGVASAGGWSHMCVDLPKTMVYHNRLKNEYQLMAEKKQDYEMLLRAVTSYKNSTIETAVNLLQSDMLYRGEKVLGIAKWFLDVKNTFVNLKGTQKTNYLWKKAVTAPAGFCHISSSMIGTLLDDIEAGMYIEAVKRRFAEKMNPTQYQRPKAAPGSQNVARAEEIVAKLGIANSLKRRYARLDEIQKVWVPKVKISKPPYGVFGGVKTKKNARDSQKSILVADGGTMTWEKFQRTVLPTAHKIEMNVRYAPDSYAALVTAEDPSAPPIIQWDTEENRNPVSWYVYNGGSYPTAWNLSTGWVEVTGITLQPNMWQPGYDHQGKGVFFILKDCKDNRNTSSALFPEIMRSELRGVRATIEAYSRQNKLGGQDEASACGRLLQAGTRNWMNCELRVTTDLGVTRYQLDRWD